MDLGPHAEFIIWAYLGVAVLVLALIFYIVWEARHVSRRLKALDEKGIRRRSVGHAP